MGVMLEGILGVADRLVKVDDLVPGSDRRGGLCSIEVGVTISWGRVDRRVPLGDGDAWTTEGEESRGRPRPDFSFRSVRIKESGSGRLEDLGSSGSFGCCSGSVPLDKTGNETVSISDLMLDSCLIISSNNLGGSIRVPDGLVSGMVSLYSASDRSALGSGRLLLRGPSMSVLAPLDLFVAFELLFVYCCGGGGGAKPSWESAMVSCDAPSSLADLP